MTVLATRIALSQYRRDVIPPEVFINLFAAD
jgi:hypothetical protein